MIKLNIEKIKEHAHIVQDLQCTVVFHKDDNNVTTAVVYANQYLGGIELVRYTDTAVDGRDMIEQLRLIIQEQKESAKTKTIGDLTLREIIKEHTDRKYCEGCPYDSNHLTNDCKTHLCRIGWANVGLVLGQEIEVDKSHGNT